MVQEEGCCLNCLETFPECRSPCTPTTPWSISPAPSLVGVSTSQWPFGMPNFVPKIQDKPSDKWSDSSSMDWSKISPRSVETWYPTNPAQTKQSTTQAPQDSGSILDNLNKMNFIEFPQEPMASVGEATTVMICNIPCKFGYSMIVEAIHSVGFAGMYDFVHVPNRKGKCDGNIGYAFVNFKNTKEAESFAAAFQDFQFPGTSSSKKCTVKLAHQQGHRAQHSSRRGGVLRAR